MLTKIVRYREDIEKLFQPSLRAILTAIEEQQKQTDVPIKVNIRDVFPLADVDCITLQAVFLVGGFAASDYLFTKVQEQLQPYNYRVSRPDGHLYARNAPQTPLA
jgi:tRNA A37 threonylcarbamoyltransferase TsaD